MSISVIKNCAITVDGKILNSKFYNSTDSDTIDRL